MTGRPAAPARGGSRGAISAISRAVAGALLGALAGAACLAIAFTMHPDLSLEMDRDLPPVAAGFYPVERAGDVTFAWTMRRAEVVLAGAPRRSPWSCSVRFRGGRSDPIAQPAVDLAIDGVTLATRTATNDFQDLEATAPARPSKPGLRLAIVSSTTFVPGPADRRELGVQIDRLVCRPGGAVLVLPPHRALLDATLSAAVLGGVLALAGMAVGTAAGATLLLAAAQAVPLTTGAAPYTAYEDKVIWLAIWIMLPMVLGVKAIERWTRQPLRGTARFVAVFSAGALYLELLALMHPAKPLVDALFQAHRFEWVLAGQFYFTQHLPDGVLFPYAIGLYLFAAPWSVFTTDHVTLLRIVVCASEAVAGALLYVMIVRTWGDRFTGALAVVLFHLVPLSYGVVGNANLTNAFGQSAALAALVAATVWPLPPRDVGRLLVLIALASLAFLSHVSTFTFLAPTLLAAAFFRRWRGGPALGASARSILLATTMAAAFSIASYYGHFAGVYKTFGRVRAQTVGAAVPAETPQAGSGMVASRPPAPGTATTPLPVRITRAAVLSVSSVGWPILILALIGAWRLWAGGAGDRLAWTLAAWGAVYLAFLVAGILSPVDMRYQRQADEFIGRITYATYPAAVVLAARGGLWAWRAGVAPRMCSAVLLLAAAGEEARQWLAWMR